MAFTPIDTTAAGYLAEDALAKWLIETLPIKIQIAQVWPYRAIDGKKLNFARQAAITYNSTATNNGFANPIADSGAIYNQTSAPTQNDEFKLGMLATRYQMSYSAIDQNRVPNNIDAVEAALAIRRLLYSYFRMIDVGTGSNGQFSSLISKCAAGQILDLTTGTTAATLDNLDDVYYRIESNNGRPNAIMSNSKQARQYMTLCRASGFSPEYIDCQWTDPIRGTVNAPMLSLHGTPWYINDCIERRGTDPFYSNIYFMVLGDQNDDPGPSHGITGIIPAPLKDTMFVRRETPVTMTPTDPTDPTAQTVDQVSLVNVDYTWPVGIAFGAEGSLAIIKDGKEI